MPKIKRRREKWDPRSQARKLRDVNLAEELQEVRGMVLGEGSAWDMQGESQKLRFRFLIYITGDGYYT